jgi:hypothetical protein
MLFGRYDRRSCACLTEGIKVAVFYAGMDVKWAISNEFEQTPMDPF